MKKIVLLCNIWGNNAKWVSTENNGPHEANFLKLDCSKIKSTFNWKPRTSVKNAIEMTIEWEKERIATQSVEEITQKQIKKFIEMGELI